MESTFYRLSRYILSCKIFTLLFFSLENDDMESSKRCAKLISLIFIINCFEFNCIFRHNFVKRHGQVLDVSAI